MNVFRNTLVRALLTLQGMLVVVGPQAAMVLCIDPGRHVTIELGTSRCSEAGFAASPLTVPDDLKGCSADACVRCIDLPVGASGTRHAAPRAPQLSPATVVLALVNDLVPLAAIARPPSRPNASSALALSIPTTILRV